MNRNKRVTHVLLAFYVAASASALSLPLAAPVRAVKACVSYLFDPVPFYGSRAEERFSAVPSGIASLIATNIENRRLQEEAKRVPLLESRLGSLEKENARLREEMSLKPRSAGSSRWARVIERDPLNWYRALMIDAGRDDGVEVNAPVLAVHGGRLGAVGRIAETGAHWSKVLLLTNEASAVAAYVPGRGWEGLVEGDGSERLRMNYLPLDAAFSIGDPVSTSATSATFPPDVAIGHVARLLQQDPFLTFQSLEVVLAAPVSALKEVLVLAPRKAARESPE